MAEAGTAEGGVEGTAEGGVGAAEGGVEGAAEGSGRRHSAAEEAARVAVVAGGGGRGGGRPRRREAVRRRAWRASVDGGSGAVWRASATEKEMARRGKMNRRWWLYLLKCSKPL